MSDQRHVIIAVVPMNDGAKWRKQGWRGAGRNNGYTETLFKIFATVDSARKAGHKLPILYSIEPCPAGIT